MGHIFISYSHKDSKTMRLIRDGLRHAGFDVWSDENLEVGTPKWQSEIAKAIEKSWALVVLLSPDARDSGWIDRELLYAEMHNVIILPVHIDGTEQKAIPISLVSTQRIDLRTRFFEKMQTLVDMLTKYQKSVEDQDAKPVELPAISSERGQLRLKFWEAIKKRSAGKTTLFANIRPQAKYWIDTTAGTGGFRLVYRVSMLQWAGVELYIDVEDETENKAIFDTLYSEKSQIEREYGHELEWMRIDNKRACRIVQRFNGIGLTEEGQWPELQDTMIDAMIRLDKTFRPRLKQF